MSLWLSTTSLMAPSVPPWLEDVCQKLAENDESFKTVELTHPRVDDVFARIFAKALEENNTATTLILSCLAIVDDGAYAIGSVLGANRMIQRLQFRDLRNSREVATFFRTLQENVSVEELSLRHSVICPQGAESIANFLKAHPKLQEVRFVDTQFSSNSLQIICQGLKKTRSLQRLYLVNTEIGPNGATHMADMLQNGSCLRELYLCENNLGDDGVATLASGVLGTTSLRLLDLRSNGITSTGAMSLQGIIARSQFLVTLQVSNNELGNLGVAALTRGLQQPACVLQQLDVSENNIDAQGANALACMLRTNESLLDLNISFNSVGDEGATAIARSLQSNSTLRYLNLRRNGITNQGAKDIATRLPLMNGLKELMLNKNNIDHVGCCALLNGLRSNVEIEYLSVDEGNKVSEPISREIVHWIRLNKAGRRIFRNANNVPNPLWSHVYGRISHDCDILFHFLKEKPEVAAVVVDVAKSA